MSKSKKPFTITGPGVYATNHKVYVEIIGRPFRHTKPIDPKDAKTMWVGVKMDVNANDDMTLSAWTDDGTEADFRIGNVKPIGRLVRREYSFDTIDEIKVRQEVEEEMRWRKNLMTETALRRNVSAELIEAFAENDCRGYHRAKPFNVVTGYKGWKVSKSGMESVLRWALDDLDKTYYFAGVEEETDPEFRHFSLSKVPGKSGLLRMQNAEDVVIYVADRLGITLKQKPWITPTIKLPAKKQEKVKVVAVKAETTPVSVKPKIAAKQKKPAKIPTVKMVVGAYYKDGKGKIHGPMRKLKKSELIGLSNGALPYPWIGALRNANMVSCSKLGSGGYFNHLGRAIAEGKEGINHLIARVTYHGDRYEDPEVDDSYLD